MPIATNLQRLLKDVRKLLEETRRAATTLIRTNNITLHVSKKFLIVQEALAAIEGPEFGEGELDLIIAQPDITVVGDEEGMDKDDLTVSKAMLADATEKIEIHFNPIQSDDMPTTSVPKIKRCTKVKWSKKKLFLSSPVSKKAHTLEDLEKNYLESHQTKYLN